LALATMQYAQDNDGSMPTRSSGNINLHVRLQPYVKSIAVFRCPSQSTYTDKNTGLELPFGPSATNFSYSYNFELADGAQFNHFNGHIDAIPYPSRTCLTSELRGMVDRVTPVGEVGAAFEVAPRHFEGANVAFVDGHVKWYPLSLAAMQVASPHDYGNFWQPTATSP
jgi:prepilin-type processing-associated H-X9-DG protein